MEVSSHFSPPRLCSSYFVQWRFALLSSHLHCFQIEVFCPYLLFSVHNTPSPHSVGISTFFSMSLVWSNLIMIHREDFCHQEDLIRGCVWLQSICGTGKAPVVMQKWDEKCYQQIFGIRAGMKMRRKKEKRKKKMGKNFFSSPKQKRLMFSSLLYQKCRHEKIVTNQGGFLFYAKNNFSIISVIKIC